MVQWRSQGVASGGLGYPRWIFSHCRHLRKLNFIKRKTVFLKDRGGWFIYMLIFPSYRTHIYCMWWRTSWNLTWQPSFQIETFWCLDATPQQNGCCYLLKFSSSRTHIYGRMRTVFLVPPFHSMTGEKNEPSSVLDLELVLVLESTQPNWWPMGYFWPTEPLMLCERRELIL